MDFFDKCTLVKYRNKHTNIGWLILTLNLNIIEKPKSLIVPSNDGEIHLGKFSREPVDLYVRNKRQMTRDLSFKCQYGASNSRGILSDSPFINASRDMLRKKA